MVFYPAKFDIHGVIVEILSDDPLVRDILSEYLSYFKIDRDPAPAIIFKLERHDISKLQVQEGAYRFFNYYNGITGFEKEGKYYYVSRESIFRFDPNSSGIDAVVSDEIMSIPRFLTHGLFTIVLMESLRYHGLYFLHGAAVKSPRGTSMIITGDAATGKTTITVSLIHLGWNWLTDDTVFLRKGAEGVEILPFVREFHIPPTLAGKIQELRFLLDTPPYFSYNPKRALKGEELYRDQKASSIKRPDVVLFTYIADAPVSRVERMSSLDALNKIVRTSPLVLFSKGPAKAHLETLRETVEGARCYKLYSGRDMVDEPLSAVSDILSLIGET